MENQNPLINFFRKIGIGIAQRFEGQDTPAGQFFSKLLKGKSKAMGVNQRKASVINQTQAADPNSTLLS